MKLESLKNKKILIVGYGIEGKATYKFLQKYFPSQKIGIADKNNDANYLELQKQYDIAIKSPGIHKSKITIPYTTATNLFFSEVKGVTIGITGSKGKSTTASLLYTILKQAGKKVHLVGNIIHKMSSVGNPMLIELMKENTKDDIWICELSSYQLDDITYSPHIAVITSFFPEHLDYHGSLEQYWEAKKKIILFSKDSDIFVYNPSFEKLKILAKETKATPVPYEDLPFAASLIPVPGKHNVDNVRATVTVAHILDIDKEVIKNAVKSYIGLPHRMENIGTFNGITFYDDAIATTPEATIQAIVSLESIETIFLGGQDRGFDFSELAKVISESHINTIVFFPDSGETIYKEIQKKTNKKYTVLKTKNMEEAVKFSYNHTPKGGGVLLSTASPSYSVWKNFEEKGTLFKEYVKKFAR
jgi:UDP-N-acetylmuramoylalanine--D-glutamate ligase